MAIRLRDRVKQGTVSAGTGTITLSTSFVTFQDFSGVLSDGDTTYYTIENSNDFEVGEGTYSGNTLSRDQVFSSSNTGSLISLAGSSTVFITYPASKSVHLNGSGNVTGIECIDFKLGVTPAYSEGRVFYDNVNHALAVYNDEADITLQVGQEEYLRVRNNSATGILNGQVVRLVGSQGTSPTVKLAIATDFDSSNVMGLATHDIENNSFGYVTTFGLVNDVDTSDFAEGSELYLSPLVSGGLTGVAPSAPFYQSPIGVCVREHPSVGTVLVQPRATKLGGFDVKSLGDIQNSGVPFISEQISESSGAILATNTGFYYSVSTDTLNAVNLDVAGRVLTNRLENEASYSYIRVGAGTSAPVRVWRDLEPQLDNGYDLGASYLRWSNTYSVDGSFSGNLISEVGGSIRHYGSGTQGDTDTHYSETSFDGVYHSISTVSTGAASNRSLMIKYANQNRILVTSGEVRLYKYLRPSDSTITIGSDADRFGTIFGIDGSFSGNLDTEVGGSNRIFNLGSDADVAAGDTEYLETSWDTNKAEILSKKTGAGAQRELTIGADGGYQVQLGSAAQGASLAYNSNKRFYWSTTTFAPFGDNLYSLGGGASFDRWANVFAVNGSFGGNLDTEVGGSNRIFNLGSDADVAAGDTEYLETSFDTNVLQMFTVATGSGVRRNLEFGNADNQVNVKGAVDQVVIRTAGTAKLIVGATSTSSQDLTPSSHLSNKLGTASTKWSEIYAAQGRFESLRTTVDVETAATVTMVRATDHTKLCDCTSNPITVNLDAANAGIQYTIKKTDASANAVTIDGFGAETIDGAATKVINTQYESVTIVSDGSNWFIV